MFEIGDKENLDKLIEALMKDKDHLFRCNQDLEESLAHVQQLQEDLQKSSDAHKEAFASFLTIESASKGHALLMWDALRRLANSLNAPITDTRASVDTLQALENDYDQLIDYANDASWTIQILRNRDLAGLEVYPPNVPPLKSIWGAETTP